jgi:hypothetical protein
MQAAASIVWPTCGVNDTVQGGFKKPIGPSAQHRAGVLKHDTPALLQEPACEPHSRKKIEQAALVGEVVVCVCMCACVHDMSCCLSV